MTAPVPDHASLPVDELNRRLWITHLDSKYPGEAISRAFCAAMDAANDAAREVLELMPLGKTVTMHPDFWKYAQKILGAYDWTVPTGTRIGKRWTRTMEPRQGPAVRYIGEYTADSIVWRAVELSDHV